MVQIRSWKRTWARVGDGIGIGEVNGGHGGHGGPELMDEGAPGEDSGLTRSTVVVEREVARLRCIGDEQV